jgi:hypothetical protein
VADWGRVVEAAAGATLWGVPKERIARSSTITPLFKVLRAQKLKHIAAYEYEICHISRLGKELWL